MVQDETDIDETPGRRRRTGPGAVLLAGFACAGLLGAGLGLWARPELSERGPAPAEPAAQQAAAPQRRLQIVFDDAPAAIGPPLQVMDPQPAAASPVARPEGLLRVGAPPRVDARPAPEPVRPAMTAEPSAHALLGSARAWLLEVAAVAQRRGPPPEPAPTAQVERPAARPRPARTRAEVGAHARAEAPREERAHAQKALPQAPLAREARNRRARDAALAQARAEDRARAEARRTERLRAEKARIERASVEKARVEKARVEQANVEEASVEKIRAERRAEARAARARKVERLAQARAGAAASARRRKARLAVLAQARPKAEIRPARAPRAAPAPARPAKTIRADGSLRLASAPRCAANDPGAALACADPVVGAAERRMNRAYREAEAAGVPEAELRRQQARWLAARAAAARDAPWAVRDVYQARIAELVDEARAARD
jgi:hypothetical protein